MGMAYWAFRFLGYFTTEPKGDVEGDMVSAMAIFIV